MFLRPSSAFRATRVFTAAVTVWCLGCAGFEPLLDALMGQGASAGMVCGEQTGTGDRNTGMSAMSEVENATGDGLSLAMHAASQRGLDCGCAQTCQATSHRLPDLAQGHERLSHVVGTNSQRPLSVVRTPLPPPPQA